MTAHIKFRRNISGYLPFGKHLEKHNQKYHTNHFMLFLDKYFFHIFWIVKTQTSNDKCICETTLCIFLKTHGVDLIVFLETFLSRAAGKV